MSVWDVMFSIILGAACLSFVAGSVLKKQRKLGENPTNSPAKEPVANEPEKEQAACNPVAKQLERALLNWTVAQRKIKPVPAGQLALVYSDAELAALEQVKSWQAANKQEEEKWQSNLPLLEASICHRLTAALGFEVKVDSNCSNFIRIQHRGWALFVTPWKFSVERMHSAAGSKQHDTVEAAERDFIDRVQGLSPLECPCCAGTGRLPEQTDV